MSKKTVCLNMIVKNESRVIRRCLVSVKPIIDSWVIVDTGSTDGTQQIVQEFLHDIPGQLHERPWINFSHNRNEALAYAKNQGDYLLLIDADDELKWNSSCALPELQSDSYYISCLYGGNQESRFNILIKNGLDWKWQGVVHERLVSKQAQSSAFIDGVILLINQEGDRSGGDLKMKNLRDARLLEEALRQDPENRENVFLLAMCYDRADENELALRSYERRAVMGGSELEVYASLYRTGVLQEQLGMEPERFLKSYSDAYRFRPTRAEPLFRIAHLLIGKKLYFLGYLITRFGLSNPLKNDYFYSESHVYSYGLLTQFAECAHNVGRYDEAIKAMHQLIKIPDLPKTLRESIEQILDLFRN
jgi:glycosyltransferase involved in cell wall biosynthesis